MGENTNAIPAAPLSDEKASSDQLELSKFRHDARNQLNLIIGYVDLLDREAVGALNGKQRSYAEKIRSAAAELDRMVNCLLRSGTTSAGS